MLGIAVLGTGRIGRMHAANIALHPRAALAGVFDTDAAAAEEVAGALGARLFDSAEAATSSAEVDAVLIATSTATHADLIEMAAAAGKPVLCEKPIDLDLARVDACARAISGSGVPVMLGFVRRFDAGHLALKRAIEAGEIGEVQQIALTSRDPDLAPAAYIEGSGGIFRDMTIHDFDMARFLLGEEPVEIFAAGSRLVAPELMARCGDYDTATLVLATGSGRQCTIFNSRRAVYGYDQRVEVLGSAGMLATENLPETNLRRFGAEATGAAPPYMNFFIERYGPAFAAEIGEFVEAVETGRPPAAGFEDGREALRLAEAATRSAAEGRAVRLGEIG